MPKSLHTGNSNLLDPGGFWSESSSKHQLTHNARMSISYYLKEIGRGRKGARSLEREQAADLFTQLLEGDVSELEVGAFCIAMRIKGESPEETAGFLDATRELSTLFPTLPGQRPVIVLPSYNGARKLPVLTPLLALLLSREGFPVLIHGTVTESGRIHVQDLLSPLGIAELSAIKPIANGELVFAGTELICPGITRLLEVRRTIGLRNSAHSIVKLMNPCEGPSLVLASYTHPEYAISMAKTLALTGTNTMLLRGTEGESVADPRRMPAMAGFIRGEQQALESLKHGPLPTTVELPADVDVDTTVRYIQGALNGTQQVTTSIARQIEHIVQMCSSI